MSEVFLGWSEVSLRDVVVPTFGLQTGPFGSQLHASEYTDSGVPVIMPKDIVRGRLSAQTIARIPEELAQTQTLRKHRVKAGDVVFGRRGDIGRCCLIGPEHEGWLCGTGCLRARPGDAVYPSFLIHRLQSAETVTWLNENAVGQTMLNLNATILGNTPLTLPPLPEQKKIAAILSSVDEAIQATRAVIEQTRRVKEGLLQDLLTNGIGRGGRPHTRFKQTEIGEIPESWEVSNVDALSALVTSGSRGWAKFYADQGACFVRITNLTRESLRIDLSDSKFVAIPPGSSEGKRTRLLPGDVLVSITADLGIIGLVEPWLGEGYINQHIALVRLREGSLSPAFLAYYLSSRNGQDQFGLLNDAGAKAALNLPSVRSVRVPIPPREEQDRIVDKLKECEETADRNATYLDTLVEAKAGLLQDLLTGKVRVTV